MKKKQVIALFLSACMLTGCGGEKGQEETEAETVNAGLEQAWAEASSTPFGYYPETVKYTLAKEVTEDNSKLPSGESYENNAYTRLIREIINAQNQDIYENSGESYSNGISMMIATGQIADVMVVSENAMYTLQDKGMLADLTEAYENCASDKIKDIYESYGDTIFDSCTFDGCLMAIPETNISNGPNLCWVRRDYLTQAGLSEPKTLEDVEKIAGIFARKNIGCTEDKPNIGLACNTGLTGNSGIASEFVMDLEFAAYGASPQQWREGEDGTVCYGSVQPEARDALEHLQMLYQEKVIDQDFLVRTQEDIAKLIVEGRCGIFFGPWWAPNNPLWECWETDPGADWIPCLIANGEDGETRFYTQKMTGNYVVVRKGYEHPEVVLKIISVMFDYMRYSYEDPDGEFELYYRQNVDPTARPLSMNVDYSQALDICYENICSVLQGEKELQDLELLERSYYQVCKRYIEEPEKATAEEWSGYMTRIAACALLSEGNIVQETAVFPRIPDDLMSQWYGLKDLEQEVYLKIIRGEASIKAFDDFVDTWYQEGGAEIIEILQNASK